jgi:hypothetical protein
VRPIRVDLTRSVDDQALGELFGTDLTSALLRCSACPVNGRNAWARPDVGTARLSSSVVSDRHLNTHERVDRWNRGDDVERVDMWLHLVD